MTLFAGIVSVHRHGRAPPAPAFAALVAGLSRQQSAYPTQLNGRAHALAFLDIGIFEGGCLRTDDSGALSLFAGDPLVDRGNDASSRPQQLDRLHEEWKIGSITALQGARGSFCAMHFEPSSSRLWLVADKLGLRPIYYAQIEGLTVFATSLRALESCPLVQRRGDLQGVAETACFGYALGPRTVLESVHVLEAGQILEVRPASVRYLQYWRWDRVPTVNAGEDEICADIRTEFTKAIRLRLGNRRRTVSLLSAGLDSRCVTAMLRASNVEVHTIGFGPDGSADHLLARQAAGMFGTRHFEFTHGATDFWPRLAAAHLAWSADPGRDWSPAEAGALWSGEGGDRILAPVNLYEDVIDAMRAGDPDGAISHYMRAEHTGLPRRLFTRRFRNLVLSLPRAGLRAELDKLDHEDPAKRFHLYVLVNEARRNIKQHFEDLDLSRVELVMPFYDSTLVQTVLRNPLDPLVRHRLYHRWLTHLPAVVRTIPWQAYPGALPCPMPLPADLRSQWDGWYTVEEQRQQRQSQLAMAAKIIESREFPDWLLRRLILRIARRLLQVGCWQFSYLFDVASPFVAHPPVPLPRSTQTPR